MSTCKVWTEEQKRALKEFALSHTDTNGQFQASSIGQLKSANSIFANSTESSMVQEARRLLEEDESILTQYVNGVTNRAKFHEVQRDVAPQNARTENIPNSSIRTIESAYIVVPIVSQNTSLVSAAANGTHAIQVVSSPLLTAISPATSRWEKAKAKFLGFFRRNRKQR